MKAYLRLVFIVTLFSLSINALTTGETNALASMKTSLNHDSWISTTRNSEVSSYDTRWGTQATCGSGSQNSNAWFGVICAGSGSSGHVEVLLLAANNLAGALPSNLNGLTYLKQLYLFDNSISGSIPSLSGMTRLTHLYIWDNSLTSVTNIANTDSLVKFYFENNNVNDNNINWISTLDNILEVDGSDNSITGTIPNNIQSASNLRKISFRNNGLTGNIPRNLLEHPEMVFIYLSGNSLTGSIPSNLDISGLSLKLQDLDFSDNDLRCLVPAWISEVNFPIDISGNDNLYCPVPAPSFSLTSSPEDCLQIAQTGASPLNFDLFASSNTITITATNLGACNTGGFQCQFTDQFGGAVITVDATSSTATTITCPFPAYSVGGGRTACVAQQGEALTGDCTFVTTEFDCSSLCQNGGFCIKRTGQCVCPSDWKGEFCEIEDCGDCNEDEDGGVCVDGECVCNPGWLGPNCNFGAKTCAETCEPNGVCNPRTGTCICQTGWQGAACDEEFCPPCFATGGTCVDGACECIPPWSGVLCNVPNAVCPGDGTCGSGFPEPRGRCDKVTGQCVCFPGWQGELCDEKPCPFNCFEDLGRGTCNTNTGECTCNGDYALPSCQTLFIQCPGTPPCSDNGNCITTEGRCNCRTPFSFELANDCSKAPCPANCTGHGTCDSSTGVCACEEPWEGPGCSINPCPSADCSGQGACDETTGTCNCNRGYSGESCEIKDCPGPKDPVCSGKGECDTDLGICLCVENYIGSFCGIPDFNCTNNCTYPNGECNRYTGVCRCASGFDGESCTARTCDFGNGNCTFPNGNCNTRTGQCICEEGFEGADCGKIICVEDCVNGECNSNIGNCSCDDGYRGDSCALISCPDDCSGKGSCVGGVCFCEGRWGWKTDNCSDEAPDYALIAVIATLCVLGGLVLIGIIFMVWRQVMIASLTAQLAAEGGAVDMNDISD